MMHLMILLDTIQKDDPDLSNEVEKRMNPVVYLRWSFFGKIVNG